jgi:hypothetical protein
MQDWLTVTYVYVPDWNAIAALAGMGGTLTGLVALIYSVRTLRRQLTHQAELEAKRLEQELLMPVMDLARTPHDAAQAFIMEIVASYGSSRAIDPDRYFAALNHIRLEYRRLSMATAAAIHVLRRSRPRRFPRGVKDRAFEAFVDLIHHTLDVNSRLLQYCGSDVTKFDPAQFERDVGDETLGVADRLRRFTGELLARMYGEEPEWLPIEYGQVGPPNAAGLVPHDFIDSVPLGKRE